MNRSDTEKKVNGGKKKHTQHLLKGKNVCIYQQLQLCEGFV